MGAPRRKGRLVARRKPGDEEDGSALGQDDSLSEASVPSDLEDDADGEGSESSDADTRSSKQNGRTATENGLNSDPAVAVDNAGQLGQKMADPDMMLNGLTIADGSEQVEEIHFDQTVDGPALITQVAADNADVAMKPESIAERRRREHEEYKKRRDADPSFVPNRGGFYMHDERAAGGPPASNGYKVASRGRGRGRGGFQGHFENHTQPAEAPWKHDLHDTVANNRGANGDAAQTPAQPSTENQLRPAMQPMSNPPPNRTFSSTVHVANIQLRVFVPGMNDPIVFSSVPSKQHTRLPHHRPPLRRDKPVRVSLPNTPVRYIFPAVDRSFIFIPRALRPNQQGFGRTRGRGSFGGPGGLRSGRNSIYGGSAYSPSIAMSRRSSFARERDGMVSPAMSVMSRVTGPGLGARLPGGTPTHGSTPVHFGHQAPYKPAPPMPFPQANYPNVPMHQPRPQKNIAVADIESPAHNYHHAQPAQQPFAHQMPPQFSDPNMDRRTSYPSQRGTPLSNIPERAIHAQPFQPYPQPGYVQHMGAQMPPPPVPPQQMYYQGQPQAQYAPNMYYYPQGPSQPMQGGRPSQPPYHQGYMQAAQPPPPPPPADPAAPSSMVAHETNGMVYYNYQSQMPVDESQQATMPYQQMGYEGMGSNYMMAPQAIYYPTPPRP